MLSLDHTNLDIFSLIFHLFVFVVVVVVDVVVVFFLIENHQE
jgi:hypothetical protein